MKIDVFISYAREDATGYRQISLVESALRSMGYTVWRDDQIRAGGPFPYEIARALEEASLVIVFWGEASVGSHWVIDEAERARNANKLVPVRLNDVTIPIGFGQLQTIDLRGWSGDRNAPAFQQIVSAMAHRLGPPPDAAEEKEVLLLVREYATYELALGFEEAAGLGMNDPISELLPWESIDDLKDEFGEIDDETLALFSLAGRVADRGGFRVEDDLPRIDTVGDLVRFLVSQRSRSTKAPEGDPGGKKECAPTAADFRSELTSWFRAAHERHEAWIEIKAGDLHRAVGGYPKPTPRMPMCCSVMRQAQRPGDAIVSAKASDGASFTVRYQLPRPE